MLMPKGWSGLSAIEQIVCGSQLAQKIILSFGLKPEAPDERANVSTKHSKQITVPD